MIAVLREVLAAAGSLPAIRTDADLEAVTRSDDDTDYTFVLNHGPRRAHGRRSRRAPMTCSPASRTTGRLTSGRFGAAVLATPRADAAPFITLSDTTD
jgi:beta-galactosidase